MTWRNRLKRLWHRSDEAHPEVIEYLEPVERVLLRPPPRLAGATLYAITAFLIACVVAASLAEVDVVVTGAGKLATTAPPVVIQPLDRAIIKRLDVRAGDMVRKGQLLATLDATSSQAELDQLTVQGHALETQLARLEAELDGRAYEPRSPDSDSLLQRALFLQRAEFVRARRDAFEQSIQRLEASLAAAETDTVNLKGQVATAREVLAMRQELLKSQSGSRLQYLEAQNTLLRFEREQQTTAGRILELRHEIAEKRSERQAFLDDWRRQIVEDLVKVRQDAAKVAELLIKVRHRHGLVDVYAPEDGVVLEVAQRTTGSVLREAEPLIVLVPLDSPLEAEVEVASADVGYLKPGDPVRLKVDAFPFQRHGLLKGELLSVSRGSFSPGGGGQGTSDQPAPPTRGAVHRGQIALADTTLRNVPTGSALIPGMTVVAEIKVGSRTVLSYLLWPILRGLDEGLREP